MCKIANRTAALSGAGISLIAIAVVIFVYGGQSPGVFLPDITAVIIPTLLFGLPLALTFIGFTVAAVRKSGPWVERAAVIMGILALLGGPITFAVRPMLAYGSMVAGMALLLGTLFVLSALYRSDLTDGVAARAVLFCGGVLCLHELMIVAFSILIGFPADIIFAVPALTLGVPALFSLRGQTRKPRLAPAAFIGIWSGIAALMFSAALGFMSIGFYVWVVDLVLIGCAMVVQFTGETAAIVEETASAR